MQTRAAAHTHDRAAGGRCASHYPRPDVAGGRARLGGPAAVVHPIGGGGDTSTERDRHEMVTAAGEHAAIGGSIYDYATSRPEFWSIFRAFRTG